MSFARRRPARLYRLVGSRIVLWALLETFVVGGAACAERSSAPTLRRTVTFRGEPVAVVVERSESNRILRTTLLDGDEILLDAAVDSDGLVATASSIRKRGSRVVREVRLADGELRAVQPEGTGVDGNGSRGVRMAALPVVLLELLHRVRAAGPLQAQLVDLASAETMPVRVERRGPEIVVLDEGGFVVARALPEGDRVGPGAFAEGDAPPSLASPPIELPVPGRVTVRGLSLPRAARWVAPPDNAPSGAEDRAPAPFLESDAGAVVDFARPLCHADVAETSRRVLEAVHPRVDAQTTNEPPSALAMLAHGGDCDGAAALVVALLRACGWSARPVVGYRLVDSGRPLARLVPHALAEVYTSTGWMRVDATVPAMGALDDVFIPIATGLGGALTMGRVLGVLDANDLVARSAPAKAPPPGPGISPSQGIEAPGTP